ncbi:hypothetical protein ACFSTC_55065 [Nonomuraea ferruginea]
MRSTLWTLATTVVLMLGVSALLSASVRSTADGPVPGEQAMIVSLQGASLAALAMATLGVLVISGEYRTGAIRTSLMAVPRRMSLLTGKIVVFTAVSLVVCLLASAGAIGVGLAIFQPSLRRSGRDGAVGARVLPLPDRVRAVRAGAGHADPAHAGRDRVGHRADTGAAPADHPAPRRVGQDRVRTLHHEQPAR